MLFLTMAVAAWAAGHTKHRIPHPGLCLNYCFAVRCLQPWLCSLTSPSGSAFATKIGDLTVRIHFHRRQSLDEMLKSRHKSGRMQPRESKLWMICKAETELSFSSQLFPTATSALCLHAFSLTKYLFFDSKGCLGANLESIRSPRRCGESYKNDVNWLQPS